MKVRVVLNLLAVLTGTVGATVSDQWNWQRYIDRTAIVRMARVRRRRFWCQFVAGYYNSDLSYIALNLFRERAKTVMLKEAMASSKHMSQLALFVISLRMYCGGA